MKIAFNQVGSNAWHGGITYLYNLLSAIRSLPADQQPGLFLHVDQNTIVYIEDNVELFPLIDGVIITGIESLPTTEIQGKPTYLYKDWQSFFNFIDFLFPVSKEVLSGYSTASWIPDFQHWYLPHLFSQEMLEIRNEVFDNIAENANLVVLSSQAVKDDYQRLYSHLSTPVEILKFYSSIPISDLQKEPENTREKYQLPERYLICCNQFWAHKDHLTLFKALSIIKKKGVCPKIVCTGGVNDSRDKTFFQRLMQEGAFLEIKDQVTILGFIPRTDQIQLLRVADALVQPSLFEGWSTVVEDARSIGLPIFLSDLNVHIEQAPENSFFFQAESPEDLADKFLQYLPLLENADYKSRETIAQNKSKKLICKYAKNFINIAHKYSEKRKQSNRM